MAKKNTKNAAPKQERPRHDDGKYGEVLYSFSYDMDDINLFNASSLIGPSRIHQVFPIASMLLLLVIIGSLYDREHPIYPLAIAAFAMTSIFICLLVTQKLTAANVVAAVCAMAGVYLCKAVGLTGPAIFIGALVGVACAFVFSRIRERA